MEPKTRKLTFKFLSEDLGRAGDYCFTRKLSNTKDEKISEAIIIKCPYCAGDMASTGIHRIKRPRYLYLSKLLTSLGIPYGFSVKPMLQCPYNPAHVFYIKNGRLLFKKINGTRSKEINQGPHILYK